MEKKIINVLLIEDTLSGFIRCKEILGENCDVKWGRNPSEAFNLIIAGKANNNLPDCIILDLTLTSDKSDGFKILFDLKREDVKIPVIIWSKHKSSEDQLLAIEKGASGFLEKFSEDDLLKLEVEKLVKR